MSSKYYGGFYMATHTKWSNLIVSLFAGILLYTGQVLFGANGVTLYTPYTKISVPPGESIDYTIDVINKSGELQNVNISIEGLPKGWNYILKSGTWNIKQLSILPGEKKNFSLKVEVPLKVDKGTYRFRVSAGQFGILNLAIIVSEQGTFKTEFVTKQSNMVGHTNSTFTFSADLKNRTADKQLYSLRADAARGWDVIFKVSSKQVSSVDMEANSTEHIVIEIKPPDEIKSGTYKIPVSALSGTTSADLELEVVITGSYGMELTTEKGLLSANITAGDEKRINLLIKNTGSSELTDIKFTSSAPVNWEVTFDPKKIDRLQSGENTYVLATIKADRKAIAGDYVTNIEAKTPEVSSKAAFRISVKTPMLWGWIGVLIIIGALGSVFYLFRKYGRR
jgi:uncharacterized membrane protein